MTRHQAVLQGSECSTCGAVGFPASEHCARCATPTAHPRELSSQGTVWAYTVQQFAPKSPPYVPPPEGFSPFAVGFVELAEGIRISAILDCEDFSNLMGAPAVLVATEPVPRFRVTAQTEEDNT